jgi:hypothetical protein
MVLVSVPMGIGIEMPSLLNSSELIEVLGNFKLVEYRLDVFE